MVTLSTTTSSAEPVTFTPIVALWAVPRSSSTAFERMMRQRGDHECFHEPFGEVWYAVGNDDQPPAAHVQPRPDMTYESVWLEVLGAAGRGPVFIKDFPHYITHLHDRVDAGAGPGGADLAFLDAFTHTFLIRDPAKTLPSLYNQWTDFNLAETGFARQRELFDLLTQRDGTPPPLIDADDLLDDPQGITAAWCAAIGIEHMPESLAWESDKSGRMTWYEGGTWHDELGRSTGLTRQKRDNYVKVADVAMLAEFYEQCLPHYEAMYAHRLRA